MYYKCTVREYFDDPYELYKQYPISMTIPEAKFRAILSAFSSKHDKRKRQGLNSMMAELRRAYASLVYDKDNSLISLDDDKQRMRWVQLLPVFTSQ